MTKPPTFSGAFHGHKRVYGLSLSVGGLGPVLVVVVTGRKVKVDFAVGLLFFLLQAKSEFIICAL